MKEPLILLPGMMCDARLFDPQIARFSVERPIMVIPLTGHDSFIGLTEEILANAPPRFALAGLSMGGITAMEIIRQAPERVTRLALLDTNPLAEAEEKALARNPQIDEVNAGGLRKVMRDEMKPMYLADGPNTGSILDLCMAMAESLGPEVFEQQSRALQNRPDQCDTLRDIQVPTLVLCGEQDGLCPPERHQMMRDLIANAELQIIAGAGHLPTLEQPEQTNAAIQTWLEQ